MPAHMHPDEGIATPMIVHESATHIVIAIEIPRASVQRHRRFLESLLAVAARTEGGPQP